MKIKVSDYIANFFADNGIETIFTVVGGGAMHMNDSFGHHPKLTCIYNHHEQASAIAAEAYYRVHGQMAACCVTSGPGAINALNGVVGAYQDSIPMIVVSGQTKTTLMTRNSGLPMRTLGNQEYDIIPTLMNATKYAETVMKPTEIRRCLEQALFIAKSGRPGPCWLEVPVDIQGSYVESDELTGYTCENLDDGREDIQSLKQKADTVINKLLNAKRPVIYAGNGIRIAGAQELLHKLATKTGCPVVTCWDSIDLMETDDELYTGRAGIMGDRAGNFAVQNSDLILAIGNRLNIYQVGYNIDTWAREAYVVDVDIDPLELVKKTIRVDLPVCADAKEFIEILLGRLEDNAGTEDTETTSGRWEWIRICNEWKKKYPVVLPEYHEQQTPINVYALIDKLSRKLPKGAISVVANGSASVVGSAAYYIGENQRFIMNCALSSMGYDLPAAVGAAVACAQSPDGASDIICIAGDGSIMMNLQELQTIVTNRLPVKIVLINNEGYHQIRLTQTNLFNKNFVGIGPQSDDLGFPSFEKLAAAFGMPYLGCDHVDNLEESIDKLLNMKGCCLMEVFCDTAQAFVPKSATKRLEDGTLVSPPLEDLAPFLDREELEQNMIIDMIN